MEGGRLSFSIIIMVMIKTGYDEKHQSRELEQKVQKLRPRYVFTHAITSLRAKRGRKRFQLPRNDTEEADRHPKESETDRIG